MVSGLNTDDKVTMLLNRTSHSLVQGNKSLLPERIKDKDVREYMCVECVC